MANIERDKSEELSVEELVSKLKNNINSNDVPSDEETREKQDSMKRGKKNGNDIASMLRRFLPGDENDEFELDDTQSGGQMEFEFDPEDAEFDGGEFDVEEDGEVPDQFELADTQAEAADDVYSELENIPERTLGGESLLAGFASALESDGADEMRNGAFEQTAIPDADELPDIFGAAEDSDFAEPEPADEGQEQAAQLYVFDTPEAQQPEEEYYADSEKNPLAFEPEDDGPAVPDGSAFEGVDSAQAIEAQMMVENKFSELSEDELNLMVGLGYENQIYDEDSKKKADEIAEKNSSDIIDPIDVDNSFAFDGMELSSSDQFRAVGNRYKQEHKLMKLRLIGTIVLTLALLLFETITALSDAGGPVSFGGALNINRYPVVNIMISLQLLVLTCALSVHRLLLGLKDAVTFKPSPVSLVSVVVLCCIVYDVIMAFVAPGSGLRTYNLTAAIFLFGLVLNDYLNLSREIRAFNTVSTRKPKLVVTPAVTLTESGADEGAKARKSFEVKYTGFVENYFRRTNVSSFSSKSFNLIIFPFIALAVILGILSYMANHNAATAFNISILTVTVGMPLSAVFISCYPIFAAARQLFKQDATIIGDPSVEEYSDATSVVFQDKEVFPANATIMRGIKLYGDNVIYDVLGKLTKLYTRLGGPLKEVLEQATSEICSPDCTKLLRVEYDGVEAVIDSSVTVLAGQRQFMIDNGIAVDDDSDDIKMQSEGVSALYMVIDGELCAKLYVQYDIDHSFEETIEVLAAEGIDTYIRTADPCIDDELLSAVLAASRFPARTVKRGIEEPFDGYAESADSGIISRGSPEAVAKAVVLCNKIQRVRRTSRSVCIVSSIIGVVMMVLLAWLSSEPNIMSLYTVIYQIFWLIPMALFTRLFIK